LNFSDDWLKENPLLHADLKQEKRYLEEADIVIKYK